MNFKISQLHNSNRLNDIYNLRVLSYENSPKSNLINSQTYPNGMFDSLDSNKNTLHWIVEDNNIIVASARLAILDDIGDIKDVKETIDINKIPNTRPFAYFSRLVILEDYRKSGIRSLLDDIRIEYLKKNENIKFAVAWAISKRHNSLEELGFNNIGSNNYSWANGFSEELSMYLKINTQ